MDFNDFLNERRITIKRRYTENHPAIKAGQSARVRNKILEAIADGSITTEEFDKIVSELSNDSKRWVKRNSQYFSISEEGVSLSKFGKRILNNITVNEAYDGNMSDFKYEFPQTFTEVTGNSEKAIKKISKAGKGYEVRTSIYMSEPEMKKVGDAMGMELVSYEKSSNIVVSIYESVVTEAWFGPFVFNDKMSDDELKAMYNGALDGYAYHTKEMQYPKSDYKKAYQAIEKILKERGISVDESVVTEKYNKKSLMKAMKKDDGLILVNGNEYIIYKYGNGNNDNDAMWNDDSIFALDQDGEEHEIKYTDIERYSESVVTEATTKNPEVWVPASFDKAISKFPNRQITRELVLKLADKHDVDPSEAIPYVEFGWDLDLSENTNTDMKNNFIYESFTEFVSAINEGKRENGKVVTAWKKMGVTDLNSIAKIYADAMEDANFHREIGTSRAIGSASQAKKDNYDASNISSAAGWSGYAIANGTVNFLRSIGEEAAADKLLKAITKFDLNESLITEAFKSAKLSSIASMANGDKSFFKSVANFTRVKLDQITDDQVIEMHPTEAYKTKAHPDALFFYISDNEKENPYADRNSWSRNIPGNTLLAVANGRNEMFELSWASRWGSDRNQKTLKNVGRYGNTAHGIDKRNSGYGASGLSNVKRLSEVADRVLMFDPSILPSSVDQRAERATAKAGAVAFMTDKEFKAANTIRYKEILATRALNDNIDKMVEGAISELADQIKGATKAMKLGRYGELIIGLNSKGNEAKLADASNHMSRILDNYSRYADYLNKAKEDESRDYYTKEAASYAKEIKTQVSKIKKLDYAW